MIKIGDEVISFDFYHRELEGPRACYVAGVVEAVGDFPECPGCPRYKIRASTRVFGGKEITPEAIHFYPPVNGTENLFGGVCDGVIKVG